MAGRKSRLGPYGPFIHAAHREGKTYKQLAELLDEVLSTPISVSAVARFAARAEADSRRTNSRLKALLDEAIGKGRDGSVSPPERLETVIDALESMRGML